MKPRYPGLSRVGRLAGWHPCLHWNPVATLCLTTLPRSPRFGSPSTSLPPAWGGGPAWGHSRLGGMRAAPFPRPAPLSRRTWILEDQEVRTTSLPRRHWESPRLEGWEGRARRTRLRVPGPSVGTWTAEGARRAGRARRAGPGLAQPLSAPSSASPAETARCWCSPLAPPPWALLSIRPGHGWEARNAGVQASGSPPGLWPSAPGATGQPRLGGNTDRPGQAAALPWAPTAQQPRGSRTRMTFAGRPAVSGVGAPGGGSSSGVPRRGGWRAAGVQAI